MITFDKLGNHGRFGNQLFQYAALKSLALKNNYKVVLPTLAGKDGLGAVNFAPSWYGKDLCLDL